MSVPRHNLNKHVQQTQKCSPNQNKVRAQNEPTLFVLYMCVSYTPQYRFYRELALVYNIYHLTNYHVWPQFKLTGPTYVQGYLTSILNNL